MQWVELFKEEKWAFVAYTGSCRLNTTRWHVIKSDSWSLLRHQLEAFGAEAVESAHLGFTAALPYNGRPAFNTVLRGHVVYRPTRRLDAVEKFPPLLKNILRPSYMKTIVLPPDILKSDDYLMPNFFVLLVRAPLPLGGRPFVPLEEKSNFALLTHKKSLAAPSEAQGLDDQLSALKDDHKNRAHASDFEILTHTSEFMGDGLKTTMSTEYLKPPADYLCAECQTFGKHYKEACYLWHTTGPKEVVVPFGPKKFSTALLPKEDDAIFYSLMHKRAKNT